MTDNELAKLINNYRVLLDARGVLVDACIDPKETDIAMEIILNKINNGFSFLKLKAIK